MSEANKQLGKRWFEEVWNKGRREAIAEMLAPDALIHEGESTAKGPEGFHAFFDRMHAAFSDIRITVRDTIAEGDQVCIRWYCSVKHTGDGLDMAATNKVLHTTGISIARIISGRIVEAWQNWDMLGLIHQIKGEPMAPTYIRANLQKTRLAGQ
jgi:predicted ester cyclase